MEIYIYESLEEIANDVAKNIIELVKSKPSCVLGLATGNSPILTYKNLVKDYNNNHTDYSKVTTFNLDEYANLKNEDKNSYHFFMNQHLFSHINIRKENINLPNGDVTDFAKECERYNLLLQKNQIDLQILGIGTNGHIGFNEPDKNFSEYTHLVNLSQSTIKSNSVLFEEGSQVPKQALTMGIKNILDAKQIVLIATGLSKSDCVKQMIEGEVTPNCPASILQNHKNVKIFLDKQAAEKLNLNNKNIKIIQPLLLD